MRGRIASLRALLGLPPASGQRCPALPEKGFISGRVATEQDIADGNAVFVTKLGDEPNGRIVEIAIPQYAYLLGPDGKNTLVIVVQAEDAIGLGMRVFGLRDGAGEEYVVRDFEVQLLGTTPPH